MQQPILHVAVVGFHHKKGSEWQNLPSLALPDGAHNVDQDVIYFLLPSLEMPNRAIFGISCYRQIAAQDLLNKSNDITRSTVQKSVCVLSKIPLFGVLTAKLQLITQAYFNERDFTKVEILSQLYHNLCDMFSEEVIDDQAALMGELIYHISVSSLVLCFKHRILVLFKLLLLERKVLLDLMVLLFKLLTNLEFINFYLRLTWHSYIYFIYVFKIFQGSLFHPYLSISYLEMIRSDNIRAYCIGTTNALFIQRRDLVDVVVTVFFHCEIDIVNQELRRSLALTAADLRFIDFIIKNVEANVKATSWEGGDEWIRLQMRTYLLSLMGTVRSELNDFFIDFNENFVEQWKLSNNYRVWVSGVYPDLAGTIPGHPFAGSLGVSDVFLRVEHSIGSSESGRRVVSAVASTGKYFSDTSSKVRSSVSSWLRGNNSRGSQSKI
ncbi:unnamed protein product [Dracunculus medinensis]|uniref:UDENN domain-containing protein n=1 Tax=Dracunculus medinensis TaxID=318479 RepID=A0A0N4UJR7_DRAME|nr:unnamed protein product [Dracunculus medinensis]